MIRDSENVKSRDWARLFNERGCFVTCSFSLASKRESDPRLIASWECLERWGIPVPYIKKMSAGGKRVKKIMTNNRRKRSPIVDTLNRPRPREIIRFYVFLSVEVVDIRWRIE